MEDILDVYQQAYSKKQPVVCLDETCKEVRGHAMPPIPARPAQKDKSATLAREDYEYVRDGSASIFMIYEPLTGKCHAEAREQRTAKDYAEMIKLLCDVMYPNAEKIILVQDNLNTHIIGSLYERYPPEEAHRLKQRLEIHYTPKHGSWLNMAEIALRLLCTQCLQQRLPTRERLKNEVKAWQEQYSRTPTKTNWRFTTKDARIRLKRLYPTIAKENSDF